MEARVGIALASIGNVGRDYRGSRCISSGSEQIYPTPCRSCWRSVSAKEKLRQVYEDRLTDEERDRIGASPGERGVLVVPTMEEFREATRAMLIEQADKQKPH